MAQVMIQQPPRAHSSSTREAGNQRAKGHAANFEELLKLDPHEVKSLRVLPQSKVPDEQRNGQGEPTATTPDHRGGEKENARKIAGPETVALHPERKEGARRGWSKGVAAKQQGAEAAGTGGKADIKKEVGETKYKYGNTQADIPANSDAGKALAAARNKIDKSDLMASSNTTDSSGLEDDSHITVRYGIDDDDTSDLRKFLEKQTPFEASLGKVTAFPPSEHSDGAAPIVVAIESPELRKLEKELDQHGSFIDRTFPEYKPHATLAYVRPEAAKKYVGMTGAEGKKFIVSSVSISKKDGSKEEVKFKSVGSPAKDPATGRDILHQSTNRAELVSQAKDHAKQFEDGLKGATRGIAGAKFDAVRPEKSPERIDEKINDEGQPIHTIPDILAGRIGVDSREAHERTTSAIKGHFKVIRDEDEFEKGTPPTNYRVHKLQVQVTPQLSAEAHIVPKEVLEANEKQHDVYDVAREADLDGKEATADKKEKQAKAINDAAMEKFNARNSEHFVTGGGRGQSPEHSEGVSSSKGAPSPKKGMTVLIGSDGFGIVRGGNPNFSSGGRWSVETPNGIKTIKGSEMTAVSAPKPKADSPWEGVDLDKTLAKAGSFKGSAVIGKPIPEMVERVKKMIAKGTDVRIFTARVAGDPKGMAKAAIEAWCYRNLGTVLPITDKKDHLMTRIYDDRAVQVEPNTGKIVGENHV